MRFAAVRAVRKDKTPKRARRTDGRSTIFQSRPGGISGSERRSGFGFGFGFGRANMNLPHYDDALIEQILATVRVIAMVGASANPVRPSAFVQKYLTDKGFVVHPVNPGHAGGTIGGRACFARLADVPEPIDMVDVFRNADAVPGVVVEVLALAPLPRVLWLQLGIRNDDAAARAEGAGLTVIQNRCPKIEYGRLSGEIGWAGVNSRRLSSRRAERREGFQHLGLRTPTAKG